MCSEITLQCRISICREQFRRTESEERRYTANNVEEWASVLTEAGVLRDIQSKKKIS
jgi:hypothetical protein